MDKFWSILCVPIGIAICFGPGVIVWFLTRSKEPAPEQPRKKAS